jgi:predicted patatin/cPLA2 family phospholipase
MAFQPNMIVISGGASKGISYCGVLNSFEENTSCKVDKIEYLAGSSVGGLICCGICLGYSVKEMKQIFIDIKFDDLLDNQKKILPMLYNLHSIDDGKKFRSVLAELIIKKDFPVNITFSQLYEKTKKYLALSGSNINKCRAEYFSHVTTPDMKILTALMITTRIPYFFPKIVHNDDYYVDGELFDPFPIKAFSKKIIKENKLIGLVCSTHKNDEIKDGWDYTLSMFLGSLYHYKKSSFYKYKKNTIFMNVKNISSIPQMYDYGREAGIKYLRKKCII